jgi:cellulose synthase/poly-beta-1,6-N-acetylglucosamine synthase-like glycosyltransferase/CheY-like chemotaxis protein/GGDEF domain-containing protein
VVNSPAAAGTPAAPVGSILLLEDDPLLAALISGHLTRAGYAVMHAEDGAAGLSMLQKVLPDLILSDVMMPNMDGLTFLSKVRADRMYRAIPVVLLTTKNKVEDIVSGFHVGADDYLVKPFKPEELLARVQAKMVRPPVPAEELPRERQTGLMTEAAFRDEALREWHRADRGGYQGVLACLAFEEMERVRARLGSTVDATLGYQVARILTGGGDPLASFGRARDGTFLMLLPGVEPDFARERLALLAQHIVSTRFEAAGEKLRLTPSIGYAAFADAQRPEDLLGLARVATDHAVAHLDLQPSRFDPAMVAEAAERKKAATGLGRRLEKVRLPLQIVATFAAALLFPFTLYWLMGSWGMDISWGVYVAVAIMIVLTALFIWIEGILAMRRIDPPEAEHYPAASAIIAAYLPNEAVTLESTIEAFLKVDYPGPLQIILAYNTPKDMPFEQVLRDISRRDPRFVPLRVVGSTSKAQNVNSALSRVSGEFVGVFDADHQPDPGAFRRAWNWLASGYDVVQGHCFIRNGDASWVARMVAIEFEQIYAVSHPGRARLHRFGIFGGSNGYWKTERLRSIRMHGFMLTEDIDSSLRVIENGGKIASDPHLISRELAPTDLKALTNQRLRWAQGWFQVSLKRIGPMLRSKNLTFRNKLGAFHLLIWREIFPWVSLQVFPIVAYWAWRAGGLDRLDWFVPLLFVLTVTTLATGPGQIFFTYFLADPEHRKKKGWFAYYLLVSFFFYSEYKNLLARVAQLKELMGERAWKVTPRSVAPPAA